MTNDNAAFEQPLVDVAQPQLKPIALAHGTTDDDHGKAMAVIKAMELCIAGCRPWPRQQRDIAEASVGKPIWQNHHCAYFSHASVTWISVIQTIDFVVDTEMPHSASRNAQYSHPLSIP
ncbi:hypothetical protein QFZ98_004793 [Paraburkholderia youngii]